MFLIDAPRKWTSAVAAISDVRNLGTASANAAVFFPRLGGPDSAPCGAIAGVFARTDAGDGVWNAPAGAGTTVVGASGTTIALSEPDIRKLNGRHQLPA